MCSSESGGALSRLAAALDDLTTDELQGQVGPQLLDRLRGLLVAQDRLAAEVARAVRQCELAQAPEHDGLVSMQSWLRGHGRLSAAVAAKVVQSGRVLAQLPGVAAACAAGAVPAEQVAVIAPVVEPEHLAAAAEQQIDLAAVDATLAGVAATRPYAELAQVVRHYVGRLDPDGPEPDPTDGRSFRLMRQPDGGFRGYLELDATGGEKVQTVLESHLQAGRCAGDTRSRDQQAGDALVQWADNSLASGQPPILRTVKPHVAVRIDLPDLLDPQVGPGAARTGLGDVISAARARWIACDATIGRIVLGPAGEVLDLGRRHRVVNGALRTVIEARDGGCVFAGCDAPAWWCDVHHLVEWMHGGQTEPANLALLCERHHTKVHHGFRVERDPEGRWRTWRPDGTGIVVRGLPADGGADPPNVAAAPLPHPWALPDLVAASLVPT